MFVQNKWVVLFRQIASVSLVSELWTSASSDNFAKIKIGDLLFLHDS